MMDVLFNQEYVTKVHENNLIWYGYDLAKQELMANQELQNAKQELQKAKEEQNKYRGILTKAIKLLMSVQNTSAEQVMDQLDIDEAEREVLRKMLD